MKPKDRGADRICPWHDLLVRNHDPVIWLTWKVGRSDVRTPVGMFRQVIVRNRDYVCIHWTAVTDFAARYSILVASRHDPFFVGRHDLGVLAVWRGGRSYGDPRAEKRSGK
jgi:hypothetical protein